MKSFLLHDLEVIFWYEGPVLFCRIAEMNNDVYCCGNAAMPETEAEALALSKKAWLW